MFPLFLSADVDTAHDQYTLLSKAFLFETLPSRYATPMQNDLFANDPSHLDICKWGNIVCTDGVMQSLVVDGLCSHTIWVLSLDWLPPTVKHIHIHTVTTVNGWLPERLPRCLRYLSTTFEHAVIKRRDYFAFGHLPPRMEEIIIVGNSRSYIFGKVSIQNLPPTMRIIWINTAHKWKASVDTSALPPGLEYLWLGRERHLVPFFGCDRQAVQAQVNTFNDVDFMWASSKWYGGFQVREYNCDLAKVYEAWHDLAAIVPDSDLENM